VTAPHCLFVQIKLILFQAFRLWGAAKNGGSGVLRPIFLSRATFHGSPQSKRLEEAK